MLELQKENKHKSKTTTTTTTTTTIGWLCQTMGSEIWGLKYRYFPGGPK